jgi:hypothetical protein
MHRTCIAAYWRLLVTSDSRNPSCRINLRVYIHTLIIKYLNILTRIGTRVNKIHSFVHFALYDYLIAT